VLIPIQDHVFQSTQAEWSKITELVRSSIFIQVVFVCAFEINGKFNVAFFGLFIEDGQDLLTDVS
jgi:hypothetical protein